MFNHQTISQIEHEVLGTPINTKSEQKVTDFLKLTDTSAVDDSSDNKSFFQLKEMKELAKEKQEKAEKDRKLEIQQEQKLKSNEIDVSELINPYYLNQNSTNINDKGRKLFFGKIVRTVRSWFSRIGRGGKKRRRGGHRKAAPPKPQTYFRFFSEKGYLDKRGQFKNLKYQGLEEKNLFKHLFGHINLKKVLKKYKSKKIKIPYYKTVTIQKCLSKKGNKCLASIPQQVKQKRYKTIKLSKGQIPFTKYIITSLATGNEFKAKEIRRFEIFAKGYQRLFKNKIIQRYQQERARQVAKWDRKWNSARSKQELKYQRQLKMALGAYHQFIEKTKNKMDKKYKKELKKAKKFNIKQIKKVIKKKVKYYMKRHDKKFKKLYKKIKKKMLKNDHIDEDNMQADYLRNKFINRAYFGNSKVEGKVPEAYKVDKTPLLIK